MSLILEALRKSEAERRRGQVPTLHAERAPAALPSPASRSRWPWPAMAILAVLATAWLTRGEWSPPLRADAPAVVDAAARTAPASAAVAGSYPRDVGARHRDATATPPIEAADPVDQSTPPRASDIATVASARPSISISPSREDGAAPADDDAGPETAVAATVPAAGIARGPARAAAPAPAIAVAAPTARAAVASIAAAPLRLSDLSPAERLELPPLRMSMHMWDPAPARRFAIIDGARVNEGDRLGEAVVDEITAGEVVLAWRGQLLQIPLR